VLPALSLVTSQRDALPRHRGGGGVLTGLLRHSGKRCHVTAVEGGRSVDCSVTIAAAALVTSLLAEEGVPCIAQIRHNIIYLTQNTKRPLGDLDIYGRIILKLIASVVVPSNQHTMKVNLRLFLCLIK
jgi:hypothetical protein